VSAAAGKGGDAGGTPIRYLAVVPLADAVTLPYCGLPPGVITASGAGALAEGQSVAQARGPAHAAGAAGSAVFRVRAR
jgi:hypothetical protein